MKTIFALLALSLISAPTFAAEIVDEAKIAVIASERVKAIDTNGDGGIDKDEYIANATKKFDKSDTDHDGKISTQEMFAIKLKEAEDLSAPAKK